VQECLNDEVTLKLDDAFVEGNSDSEEEPPSCIITESLSNLRDVRLIERMQAR